MFSATMPPKIRALAQKITVDPVQVNIAISKPAEAVEQQVYILHENQKLPLLQKILENQDYQSVIIFCSRKDGVKQLEKTLRKTENSMRAFHSDLEQAERESIMRGFKSRTLRILIGTDILSRGIDVEGVSMVLNYDAPPDPEDYIHRIGRTARASRTGTAITFVNPADQKKFSRIEDLMGMEVKRMTVPEELGPVPVYDPEASKREFSGKKPFRRPGKGSKNDRNRPQGQKK